MTIGVDKQWFINRWTERGLSLRKVATMIGMDPGALSRTLSGERGIKIEEIGKIATVLQVSRSEVLEHLASKGDQVEMGAGTSEGVRPPQPCFGFMKGLLTVEKGYDLASPSDENWENGYLGEGRLNG